jgi:alpha-amylase
LLDEAEGITGPRVSLEVADYNLDARQEVKLENDHLIALVRPAQGGHVYELDVRHNKANVLATLDRRPEAYHAGVASGAGGPYESSKRVEGLNERLVYDRHPRKALVDHVYPIDVRLEDLIACRDVDRGDFATGAYLSKVVRQDDHVVLVMERPGWADGHAIEVRKTIRLDEGSPTLEIRYELEELPEGVPIRFAVEFNLAGMAGRADDRYYADADGRRLGMLDSRLDLATASSLSLTDEWLDLGVDLAWSVPAGVWCFPVETVSLNVAQYEGVYQSSSVTPHWVVTADASRRWEVTIRWTLDRVRRTGPAVESEPAADLIRSSA